MRRAQTAVLVTLTVILGAVALGSACTGLGDPDELWSPTWTAVIIVTAIAGALMVAAAISLARTPRNLLAGLAVAVAAVSVFWFFRRLEWWGLAVPVSGAIALTVCNEIGNRRARTDRGAVTIVCVIALVFAIGLLYQVTLVARTSSYVINFVRADSILREERSLEGAWTAELWVSEGFLARPTVSVVGHRELFGLVSQERLLYREYEVNWGDWPTMRWVDSDTLEIDGRPVSVSSGTLVPE